MSKRTAIRTVLLVLLAIVAGCVFATRTGPGVAVLEAQAVPVVLHVQWDPNPPAENVINYRVTLDGGTPITVAPTTDPSCSCVQTPITIPTFGSHTVAVVAVNLELSGDPTSSQVSSDPSSITFTLNRAPGNVSGGKIKK